MMGNRQGKAVCPSAGLAFLASNGASIILWESHAFWDNRPVGRPTRSRKKAMMVPAQTKMKALVVSRLMMGDVTNWAAFESERKVAAQITNRQTARSVSSQIGRGYRELSGEVQRFISENFVHCEYADLARLCDAVEVGSGISLRLDEFEKLFFPLAKRVKGRVPFYSHVHVSTFGLQFEYPRASLPSRHRDFSSRSARRKAKVGPVRGAKFRYEARTRNRREPSSQGKLSGPKHHQRSLQSRGSVLKRTFLYGNSYELPWLS